MYLADHLIAHFLVAAIEQLRKRRARNLAGVCKLGIGYPCLLKKHF